MNVLETIKPLFKERFIYEGELKESMHLRDDLGLDSVDLVETIVSMEELFHIEIPDEDIVDMETVEDVVKYIEGRISLA